MCEGCRHSSHPNHSFGYIADLAVVERARLTAVGTQCGTLAELLRSRLEMQGSRGDQRNRSLLHNRLQRYFLWRPHLTAVSSD